MNLGIKLQQLLTSKKDSNNQTLILYLEGDATPLFKELKCFNLTMATICILLSFCPNKENKLLIFIMYSQEGLLSPIYNKE